MRLSFLMLLLLLALQVGATHQETVVPKVEEPTTEESDPCADAAPGTVLCGRIRVPVG